MSIANALGISEEQFLNSIIPKERIKHIGSQVDFITAEQMATEYDEEDKICGNCKWYADFECVCCNGESEHRADFTDKDFRCVKFEGK